MKISNTIIAVVLLCILFLAALYTYYVYSTPHDRKNADATKNLATTDVQTFTDLEGNPITLEAYSGKVRVVNSWASWSPFSMQELKDIETIAGEFKEKNIVFIAINRKEPKESAKKFLESIQNFTHVQFVIDVGDTYYTSVGGFSMPETTIYNTEGAIVEHKRGNMTLDEIRALVRSSLELSTE
jgi:thiol-disulfide isomerase/thioredoxin